MVKKKTVEPEPVAPVEEVTPVAEVPEVAAPVVSAPQLVEELASVDTPALADKMVRVRNQGKPFLCDLTAYGYGMRWPTNAVYTIPASKYMELLKQGLDGVSA
jgi:hypothetical protein